MTTGYDYPTSWNADGPCERCGAFVGWSDKSPPGVTYDSNGVHVCNPDAMCHGKLLVVNYKRSAARMNPFPYRMPRPIKFVSTTTNTSKDKVPPLTPRQSLERRYAQLCGMRGSGEITESQVEEFHFLKRKLGVE